MFISQMFEEAASEGDLLVSCTLQDSIIWIIKYKGVKNTEFNTELNINFHHFQMITLIHNNFSADH